MRRIIILGICLMIGLGGAIAQGIKFEKADWNKLLVIIGKTKSTIFENELCKF